MQVEGDEDDDDDISLVSRSPSPRPQDSMDVDYGIDKYDEYHRGAPREVITTETKIKSTNKGFAMLAKLGWSEGQPLGLSGDGMLLDIYVLLIRTLIICRTCRANSVSNEVRFNWPG
jgi:hypothetical protein